MTYMHAVMKAMLLLYCIQAMDPYSPPRKNKKEEKGGLGNMTAATLCFYALFNWLSE